MIQVGLQFGEHPYILPVSPRLAIYTPPKVRKPKKRPNRLQVCIKFADLKLYALMHT